MQRRIHSTDYNMICTFMLMICIVHLTSACAASNGCVKAARVTIRESFIAFCVVVSMYGSLGQVSILILW